MNANDSSFIASLRDEFNAQPKPERFRTGRFMTYEAVMELLRPASLGAQAGRPDWADVLGLPRCYVRRLT